MADCLFCDMGTGRIAVPRLVENEQAFAIRDINPRAPRHALIIPFAHIEDARELSEEHAEMLGGIFALATEVASVERVRESGYRLVFNVGQDAGMTVHHLHLHLLGGRPLGPEG